MKYKYQCGGREDGQWVVKGVFDTQQEALDLANKLNSQFGDRYYDWSRYPAIDTPMKNVHVLPTDKPSRLYLYKNKLGIANRFQCGSDTVLNQNIYITSDEEIKEGDWFYCPTIDMVNKCESDYHSKKLVEPKRLKIILTDNKDLIKDGVQKIDDEFLEWFVKNPSCEEVDLIGLRKEGNNYEFLGYEIIIPKEELKQELHSMDDEVECNNCGNIMSLTEDGSIYVCYNSECTSCYEQYDGEEPKQETLEDVTEQIQNECHKFVENVSYVTYQDATNTFIFMKLAELTLKLKNYEKRNN
jgi:hypothetical protein